MTTSTPPAGGGRRRSGVVLAVCCLSLLITALDTTAVNVALPAVGRDLHAPVSGLQWTVDGYTLAVACFMMLAGSTADRIGRRRVFRTGLALFTLGSLACSLAPDLGWLISFRVAQGLGASMLNPVALSIITHAFPDSRERARAIGLWGTTVGLSVAAGPVVGGLLVASAGWRSIFWLNIPIGVAALALTAVFVPESSASTTRRPDPVGQLLVVTILTSLLFALIEGAHQGYSAAPIVALFAVSAVATAALPWYERRREQPLVDPLFFRSVPFAGSFVVAVAAFLALSGFLFLNTLYLQDVRGCSALDAGLLTVPLAVGIALASPLSGRLTAARGPRLPMVAAGLLITAAALTLTSLSPTTPWAVLLAAYMLLGIGLGLVNAPITTTAVAGMPRAQAGVSAAITTTGRQVGNTLGVALLGSVVAAHTRAAPDHAGFAAASHPGWWILSAGGLLIAAIGFAATTPSATAGAARVAARFPAEPTPATSTTPTPKRPPGIPDAASV